MAERGRGRGDRRRRTVPFRFVASDHPIRRLAGRLRNEWFIARVRRRAPGIVRRLPPSVLPPDARDVLSVVRTGTSVAIVTVGSGRGPAALIRIPQTKEADLLLRRQAGNEEALRADGRLSAWAHRIPRPLHAGTDGGSFVLVEAALPGEPALPLLTDAALRASLLHQAADVAADLHERTTHAVFVGESELRRWVDAPIDAITAALGLRDGGADRRSEMLRRLGAWLRAALRDHVVGVGWIHGDYWPGNLLLDRQGRISGVVDWDRAAPDEPGFHDLLHLVVYTEALTRGVEPGRVVHELVAPSTGGAADRAAPSWVADRILGRVRRAEPSARLPFEALVLLYWLRFVAATFEQSRYFAGHRGWVRENVDLVLSAVADLLGPSAEGTRP